MVDYSDQYHKIVIFLIIAEPMSISYDQLTLEISHTKVHIVKHLGIIFFFLHFSFSSVFK